VIFMKSYSYIVREEEKDAYAMGRVEGVDASFKDLSEVCNRVSSVPVERAIILLGHFAEGTLPVLYKSHNKRLGHRRELGGQKGRYPKKSAAIVLKLLNSVVANASVKGLIEPYIIVHASANKKRTYPRANPKGRRGRSDYETARVEIIIREKDILTKDKREEKLKEMKKSRKKTKPKVETEKEMKKEPKVETEKEMKKEPKVETEKEMKKEPKMMNKVEVKNKETVDKAVKNIDNDSGDKQ